MSEIIPLDIAHQILPNFGITKSSSLYERRVKPGGFKTDDLIEVLEEGPYIFSIDWGAWLGDELEHIASAISSLGVKLSYALDKNGSMGTVAVGNNTCAVSYDPDRDEGNFDRVMSAIAVVLPDNIEIRPSVHNGESDTNMYAILPGDYWAEVDRLAGDFVSANFKSLQSVND